MKELLLFIFCPFLLLSQQQVSDVYFDEILDPVYFNGNSGFVELGDEDYYLLDRDSLMIFELEDDVLTLKHTIDERPPLGYRLGLFHNDHASNLAIVDNNYFRFYRDRIQVIDIPTGTIISQFDLDATIYSLYRPLKIIDDYFYFRGFGVDNEWLVLRYNWKTEELIALPSFFVYYEFQKFIGHTFYFPVVDEKSIMSIDGLTGELDTVFTYDDPPQIFERYTDMGTEYIIIKDDTGTYIINEEFGLRTLDCVHAGFDNAKSIHVKGGKIFINQWSETLSRDILSVLDFNTCTPIFTYQLEGGSTYEPYVFYDNGIEDISLLAYRGNIYGQEGRIYIIDHKTNTIKYTNIALSPLDGSILTTDDNIYFLSYISGDLAPSFINLVEYDINSSSFKHLLPYGNLSHTTVMGIVSEEDELYFVANHMEHDPRMWKVDNNETFTPIASLDIRGNHGVGSRSSIVVNEDDVVSLGTGGFMITNDQTNHLHSKISYSDLIETDEEYGAVFFENDSLFALSIDKETEIVKEEYLSHDRLNNSSIEVNGYLFNYKQNKEELYYDLNEGKEKFLTHEGDTLSISRCAVGDEYLLFKAWEGDDNYGFYLFNTANENISRIEGAITEANLIFTARDNTFYLVSTDFLFNETKIQRYHPDSGLDNIYNGEGKRAGLTTANPESDDPIISIEILLSGQVRYFNASNTEWFINDLDHQGLDFRRLVKAKKGVHQIIETDYNGARNLYYLRFGEEPVLINTNGYERIMSAHIDDNNALLVYQNVDYDGYVALKYDFSEDKVSEIAEIGPGHGLNITPIVTLETGKHYIVTYRNIDTGYEPWLLDIENNTIDLLADIAFDEASSSPRNFVNAGDYMYFTAETDDGRQWFRIESQVINSTKEYNVTALETLNIFPNPTEKFIQTDKDFESLSILNAQGQVVKSVQNYQGSTNIDVSGLIPGSYLVHGQQKNGLCHSALFVKKL